MPSFPRYQSKGQLTSQTPSAPAVQDNTGKLIQAAGEVGKDVVNIGLKWSNAVDTIQKTTAMNNFKTGMLDIEQRAQNDPNYNNSEQYFKEIEKLKSESLKGFSNKQVENEMAAEFNYHGKVGQIGIENTFKKKMIDVGRAGAKKSLDMLVENPNEYTENDIKENLRFWTDNLLFSQEEAQAMEEKYSNGAKFNSFLRDFRADPVGAEKQFSKDSYGMDIETAEKARSKLKELKVMQKESEGNLFGDMTLRVITGEITDDEINSAIDLNKKNPNEGITEQHGKQLLAARYKDVTKRIGQKEFEKYKKAIDFVFSSSTQDKFKGYEAILEAYQDGLDNEETKFLKQILDTKKDVQFANRSASGKELIANIFGARPKNVEKETKALLSYAKKIAGGASPDQAARQTAVEIIQQDHPATVADPDLVVAFTPGKGLKNIPKVKRESSA